MHLRQKTKDKKTDWPNCNWLVEYWEPEERTHLTSKAVDDRDGVETRLNVPRLDGICIKLQVICSLVRVYKREAKRIGSPPYPQHVNETASTGMSSTRPRQRSSSRTTRCLRI